MAKLWIGTQLAARALLPLLIARGAATPADQYAMARYVGGLALFYGAVAASLIVLALLIARAVNGPSSSPHLGRAAAAGADVGYCFSGWVLALLVAIGRPAAADADMAWSAAVALMLPTILCMHTIRWSTWSDSTTALVRIPVAKIPAEGWRAGLEDEPTCRDVAAGDGSGVLGPAAPGPVSGGR